MKKISLIIIIVGITFQSCDKIEEPIIENPELIISDNINIIVENDTIKFATVKCLNEDDKLSSLIGVAKRLDSFGISRRTTIRTEDTFGCHINKLALGLELKDRNENYPVTKSIMEKHLKEIQNKTSSTSKLKIQYTDECYTFQNFENIFNDSIQLYSFSENKNFDYTIKNYHVIEGESCGLGVQYFLVELQGSFNGVLYTTPNVINKDSLEIDCPNFKVSILHALNN